MKGNRFAFGLKYIDERKVKIALPLHEQMHDLEDRALLLIFYENEKMNRFIKIGMHEKLKFILDMLNDFVYT
jgi:hypothetical protein